MYKRLRSLYWSPSVASASELIEPSSIPEPDFSEPVWGLIVEARNHRNLEFVVRNVYESLRIPIQIFHGQNSKESILASSIGDLVDEGKVVLTQLTVDSLYPADFYNAFLLTE